MPIYAYNSAFQTSSSSINLKINRPIPDKGILQYSKKKGAFVVVSNTTTPPYIEDARNIDTGSGAGIFKEKDSTTLVFRELISGTGLNLQESSDAITINLDQNSTSTLVSEGNFSLVIDSDNDEPSSVFRVLSGIASPGSPLTIEPKVYQITTEVIPGNDTNLNQGYLETTDSSLDFEANNVKSGYFLVVDGTDEQDGEYLITDVQDTGPENGNSVLFLDRLFSNTQDLGGINSNVDLTAYDLRVPDPISTLPNTYDPNKPYIIEASITDMGPNGKDLRAGMDIQISNSLNGDFDGTYTVSQVTSLGSGPNDFSEILLEPNTPLPTTGIIQASTPVIGNLTVTVTQWTDETGFKVNKNGKLFSTDFVTGDITSDNITNNQLVQTNTLDVSTSSILGDATADSLDVVNDIKGNSGDFTDLQVSNNPDTGTDAINRDYLEAKTVEKTSSTGAVQIPVGSTAQRPSNPQIGMLRYNTDGGDLEIYIGQDNQGNPVWQQFQTQ